MQYEPTNGFLFVHEFQESVEGKGEFRIHGGEKSVVVEAQIISPGDTTYSPGEVVVFRRDVSMQVSLGGKNGLMVHKDHVLARRKKDE